MSASRSRFDEAVRQAVYRAFAATGAPPDTAHLAADLGCEPSAVEGAYRRLDGETAIVLRPGTSEIWLANPFSAMPTGFEVTAGGRRYHAACGWDALGVLALLRTGGTVECSCPDCGERLVLDVGAGGPRREDAVLYFGVPPSRWWDDLGST